MCRIHSPGSGKAAAALYIIGIAHGRPETLVGAYCDTANGELPREFPELIEKPLLGILHIFDVQTVTGNRVDRAFAEARKSASARSIPKCFQATGWKTSSSSVLCMETGIRGMAEIEKSDRQRYARSGGLICQVCAGWLG